MSVTVNQTITLEPEECCACGVTFAITRLFQQERRRDHKNFYCPNGHPQHYPTKSVEEVLRDEKTRLTHQLDQERAARIAAQAERDRAKRKVKRAENGVCPHCNRSFPNLARHMKCKHAKVTT